MTAIEWTDRTWNPIVGCSIVSPGCTNCYAMKMAARLSVIGHSAHYKGTTKDSKAGAVWTGKLALAPEATLLEPLRRKKPTMYFVNSMGDLFHEDCPDEWIDRVFAVMALSPQHTFQVLTKRADVMRQYLNSDLTRGRIATGRIVNLLRGTGAGDPDTVMQWPLPNVWLGVSTEDQKRADERIPLLLETPAAVRFISAEPLLGPIDLNSRSLVREIDGGGRPLDWVIVGGESGHGARPMHPKWARDLRRQCRAHDVSFFFKQWGEFKPVSFDDYASEEMESEELAGRIDGFYDQPMHRVGKKKAGRLLDGKEHNAFPETRA